MLINKRQYVDGGVLNNLPVEVIENTVDLIIGSHCNPFGLAKPIRSMRGVIERSLILAVQSKTREKFGRCPIFIEPDGLAGYSPTDISKSRELFRIGYQYTRTMADQIETILSQSHDQLA